MAEPMQPADRQPLSRTRQEDPVPRSAGLAPGPSEEAPLTRQPGRAWGSTLHSQLFVEDSQKLPTREAPGAPRGEGTQSPVARPVGLACSATWGGCPAGQDIQELPLHWAVLSAQGDAVTAVEPDFCVFGEMVPKSMPLARPGFLLARARITAAMLAI